MFYYVGSSKAVRVSTEGRSTERADIVYLVASCSPLDQAAQPSEPLLWSRGPSDVPRMLFLTLQVLGAVSLLLIHSFNVLNVA